MSVDNTLLNGIQDLGREGRIEFPDSQLGELLAVTHADLIRCWRRLSRIIAKNLRDAGGIFPIYVILAMGGLYLTPRIA